MNKKSTLRFHIDNDKIKAEMNIDDLVYLFNTHKYNFDGEKPVALVRQERKQDFAKAVIEKLQEESLYELDCIRWAEPIENIFDEFLEEDKAFLKYGEFDGFTDQEIKEWKKLL